MKKVKVNLGQSSYEIHIGPGLLFDAAQRLKEIGFAGKLVIITNPVVNRLHGDSLKQNLQSEGFGVTILEVPEGEKQKSLEVAIVLYSQLADCRAERTTPILALGGGVIGDLAGFVAATYLRGLPLIQIPTTLLAQVDSSIGGKVGLDYGLLKNKIGAFYQPRLVIADIQMLKTLTPKELSDGLAEVIKYGVIWDKRFFAFLEGNLDKIKALDEATLEETVFHSARIKAIVVEKDERDFNLRHILNFGHTIGHGIETASDFRLSHGEAVAIGMLAAARISNKMGFLGKNELLRLKNLIMRAELPTKMPDISRGEIIQAMGHDKKIAQGRIKFILPKSIGKVFITSEVAPSLVEQVLAGFNDEI